MENVAIFFGKTESDKKSVLISIKNDLKYAVQLPTVFNKAGCTEEQKKYFQTLLPSYTIGLLYVTAIDLLARLQNKRMPNIGENSRFFKKCATSWFEHSTEEANALLDLRNSLTHTYNLSSNQVLRQFGSPKVVEIENNYCCFYLHAMYSSLDKTVERVYKILNTDSNKNDYDEFLNTFGFYSTFKS